MADETKRANDAAQADGADNPFAAAFAAFEEDKSAEAAPSFQDDIASFSENGHGRSFLDENRVDEAAKAAEPAPEAPAAETPAAAADAPAGDSLNAYSFQFGGENYSVQGDAKDFSFESARADYYPPAQENAYAAPQDDPYAYPNAADGYAYPNGPGVYGAQNEADPYAYQNGPDAYGYPAEGEDYNYPPQTDEFGYSEFEDEEAPRRQFAFKVRNLTKDYDGHTVLNNISFDIPAGKIVGLLGPNGCGKTTLIKILTGLIKDYTGDVKVGGRHIGITSKAHVAYLPDTTYFPGRFRTIDCIKYYADFFEDFDKIKATQFASDFGLDLNQRVKTMSKGMQEKLQLLVVMSRKADIYVLDEPLGGVDPAARGVILDIIMNNYKENATVLLSTHLVNDLEHSFDHVLMLGKGAVLVNTGIDTLRATGKSVEEIFKEVIGDAWEVD